MPLITFRRRKFIKSYHTCTPEPLEQLINFYYTWYWKPHYSFLLISGFEQYQHHSYADLRWERWLYARLKILYGDRSLQILAYFPLKIMKGGLMRSPFCLSTNRIAPISQFCMAAVMVSLMIGN